jgi:hypothetical protein
MNSLLWVAGGILWLLCVVISVLSHRFTPAVPTTDRPLATVLLIFAMMFVVYLVALRVAILTDRNPRGIVLGFAVLFRITLLPSEPIQEVDIYRYVWDGLVAQQGVSPFQFSPQEVREVATVDAEGDLAKLVTLRDSSHTVRQLLTRIHFANLPTVYPSVSQLVFRLATMTTPKDVALHWRINAHRLGCGLWVVSVTTERIRQQWSS